MAKVALERGEFNWNEGRGYRPPSISPDGRGGLPPGWLGSPDDEPPPRTYRAVRETPEDAARPRVDIPQGITQVVDAAVHQVVGGEYINLDTGEAVFMDHTIALTADGLLAIRAILAMEVCESLKREQSRVLESLHLEEMQPAGSGGGQDLPPVPSPPGAVDSTATKPPGKVLRVRKSKAGRRAKNVRSMPRTQAGEAGAGAA